jgi:hypothetical protein
MLSLVRFWLALALVVGCTAHDDSVLRTSAPLSNVVLGEPNVLSNDDSGNGNLLVAQQASLAQTATLQSMSFYIAAAAGKLRLGVYDATGPGGGPGAKVAETPELVPVVGWNTASVTAPVSLVAGTYYLAYLTDDNSLHFRVDASGAARFYSYAYGPLPVLFSTTPQSGTFHWSLYATLTVAADAGDDGPPSIATTIHVSPAAVSVAPGATQSFVATVYDQFGKALAPQPPITWSASGGSIDAGGLFTAGAAPGGPITVTATSGAATGTATVTVASAQSDVLAVNAAAAAEASLRVRQLCKVRPAGLGARRRYGERRRHIRGHGVQEPQHRRFRHRRRE